MNDTCNLPSLTLNDIEQHLRHKGAYSPLYWLLEVGLLPYGDYERWRHNELEDLEQAIHLDRVSLRRCLQQAEAWARGLKLVNDPQPYCRWSPGSSERELRLSGDSELGRLLAQRWVRPQDLPQLDLFIDSGAVEAENDLIDCLISRRWEAAQPALDELSRIAPTHPHLDGYKTLTHYAQRLKQEQGSWFLPAQELASALENERALLEQEIVPLARELLRAQAGDFLAPAWRCLADAWPAHPFDPQKPRLHASYAWAQIPDWPQVVEAVCAVPDYRQHPVLVRRLADALWYSRRREAALLCWGWLFEQAPESTELALESGVPEPLQQSWDTFVDTEESLPTIYFPAWLMLDEPGLIHHLDGDFPQPEGEEVVAVQALLRSRDQRGNEIEARRELQKVSPGLLRVYLSTIKN